MDDGAYMRRALKLAEKGMGWTSPNPMVGAVIVKNRADYRRRVSSKIRGKNMRNEMHWIAAGSLRREQSCM